MDTITQTKRQKKTNLFDDFYKYFDLSLATTEALQKQVFAVRYSVYCEEFGYENSAEFRDGLEQDTFDEHSIHCLVTHRSSEIPAGCVRLVQPSANLMMPLEDHCEGGLDNELISSLAGERHTMAEISRLCVDSQFRRRRGERETRFGHREALDFEAREKRTFSLIAVALFLSSAAVARMQGRPNCFAIMEPFLPAILRKIGVDVTRAGSDFEFNGTRAPYFIDINAARLAAPEEIRTSLDMISEVFGHSLPSVNQATA
ncbi:MAG: PEP-CTERM/exosortase system-associated acyltransferase [Pseudomonadota bacterium]